MRATLWLPACDPNSATAIASAWKSKPIDRNLASSSACGAGLQFLKLSRLARSNTATYIYYDERLCLAR